MPAAALKSLAEKHNVSVKTAERYWDEALDSAGAKKADNKYAYAMGVVKKRLTASFLPNIILARLFVSFGYLGDYVPNAETAAGRPVEGVRKAKQRGAELKINNPPKFAYKIFSTDNPFNVDGLKYAEFKDKGIEHAAYDPKTASLWISFSGQHLHRWYWYKDVPPDLWDKLRRVKVNASVFFNKEIRPIFDYGLIEKDE